MRAQRGVVVVVGLQMSSSCSANASSSHCTAASLPSGLPGLVKRYILLRTRVGSWTGGARALLVAGPCEEVHVPAQRAATGPNTARAGHNLYLDSKVSESLDPFFPAIAT